MNATPIERLLSVLRDELGLKAGDVTAETRLFDIGDSLDWMNVLTALEAEFGLRIDTTRAFEFETVGELGLHISEESLASA